MTHTDQPTERAVGAHLDLTRTRPTFRLSWSDEDGARQLPLQGRTVLGSAQAAPVRVNDRTVSRVHAELEATEEGVWVRDLGSRNGTWVEGLRIERVLFTEPGKLRAGNTVLTLSVDEKPSTVSLWPTDSFGPLVGHSAPMRELFMRLSQVSASDAPVLLHGETGTGKELVAQAIHQFSSRSKGPLVVVDCGALPESLLETELFGHTKGAFTGAANARAGAVESADGGTLFLDEIGELPLVMQPRLLRLLETKTFRRVGENEYRTVSLRFIAATHRDLNQMVASRRFREDLYFRLAVLPVDVPPLRARREDIPLLLERFVPGLTRRLSAETSATLAEYPWSGNVRELRSFAERAKALGVEKALLLQQGLEVSAPKVPESVPGAALPPVDVDVPFKELRERWVEHLEREYLARLLPKHERNISAAADAAGLDRSYVHRLIRKHNL